MVSPVVVFGEDFDWGDVEGEGEVGVGKGKVDDQGVLEVVSVVGWFVIVIKDHNVVVGHPLTEMVRAIIFFGDSGIPVRRVQVEVSD